MGSLGDEECSEAHVNSGTVGIKGIASRNHETDESLRAAKFFKFGHQRGDGRFGRANGQHQKHFFLDIEKELDDAESGDPGDESENYQYKNYRRQIESADELCERSERGNAILSDGEGHRTEGADRSEAHEDVHDAEDSLRKGVQQSNERLRAVTEG